MTHRDKKELGATVRDDGVEFRVWAPFAQAVSVLVGVGDSYSHNETVLANDDGYWWGFVRDAKPGQSYYYRIKTPYGDWVNRNDPRALQLTVSENGESIIADPNFDWEDVEQPMIPKNKQVIYELHVGTFNRPDASTGGTFTTAIEKLDYLKELGVNMIELMPITAMATSHGWGYAPNHLFAVENAYGGRRGLLEFVKAAHQKGIGVILDIVYNHVNGDSLWQFDGWNENGRGGIYFYNDDRGDTPWGSRLDYGRSEVRQFILDNVKMWLTDYKLDGLRLDSTIFMRNKKGQNNDPYNDIGEAWSLFQEINQLARKINPNVTMIAEDATNEYITKDIGSGGAGFDAQWSVVFPSAIRSRFGMSSGTDLTDEIQRFYNGEPFQKVVFGDSHDSAANGNARLNESTTPGNPSSVFARQRLIIANAIALTTPGIPMILQGEEFTQGGYFNDWQMLDWQKTEQFAGIVQAHHDLIQLRKNQPGLFGGSINVFHSDAKNNLVAYHRWQNGGPDDDTIVVINFSDIRHKEYELGLPVSGDWRVVFNSSWKGYSPDFNETAVTTVSTNDQQKIKIPLADYNVLILVRQ